jgi:hypothetical protein
MKVWQVYVNGNMVGVINDADNDGHARFLAVQRYNISPDDHCSIDPIWYNSVTGEAVSNNAGNRHPGSHHRHASTSASGC